MASSYTPSLQIELIGNGDQSGTWGTTTNNNWGFMEASVAGVQSIVMLNRNYTLSTANGSIDEARNMTLLVTGTNSGVYQVVAPLVPKLYNVVNNTSGGYAITIGALTGATVSIPNGYASFVYCDGSSGFYPCDTASGGNFYTNGNMVVQGTSTLEGAVTAQGTLAVTGTTTLSGTATAPTVTPSTDSSTKIATTAFVKAALQAMYPVGSIYTNTSNATNPATLFGFGTWTALAAGQVLLGAGTNGGNTFAAGSTGGYYAPQLLSHTHSGSTSTASLTGDFSGTFHVYGSGAFSNSGAQAWYGDNIHTLDNASLHMDVSHSHSFTTGAASSGDQTLGNLPPYLTVYMWQRTA